MDKKILEQFTLMMTNIHTLYKENQLLKEYCELTNSLAQNHEKRIRYLEKQFEGKNDNR